MLIPRGAQLGIDRQPAATHVHPCTNLLDRPRKIQPEIVMGTDALGSPTNKNEAQRSAVRACISKERRSFIFRRVSATAEPERSRRSNTGQEDHGLSFRRHAMQRNVRRESTYVTTCRGAIVGLEDITSGFDPRQPTLIDEGICMPMRESAHPTIAYREHGNEASAALLLLYGWPDDATTRDGVIAPLVESRRRAIVPSLRGFGEARLSATAPFDGVGHFPQREAAIGRIRVHQFTGVDSADLSSLQ